MAMSLKKIGAIAVGGAMVATALASGVAAEVKVIGDVSKDLFVKDGQPNCYVVVGAKAPSTMDVVSAADIAAKIGSLCYKEGTVEDGKAVIKVYAKSDSDDFELTGDWNNAEDLYKTTKTYTLGDYLANVYVSAPEDYKSIFGNNESIIDLIKLDSKNINTIPSDSINLYNASKDSFNNVVDGSQKDSFKVKIRGNIGINKFGISTYYKRILDMSLVGKDGNLDALKEGDIIYDPVTEKKVIVTDVSTTSITYYEYVNDSKLKNMGNIYNATIGSYYVEYNESNNRLILQNSGKSTTYINDTLDKFEKIGDYGYVAYNNTEKVGVIYNNNTKKAYIIKNKYTRNFGDAIYTFEVPGGVKKFVAIEYDDGKLVAKTDHINTSKVVGIGVIYDRYKIYNAEGDEIETLKESSSDKSPVPTNGKVVFIASADSDYADDISNEAGNAFSGRHIKDIIKGYNVKVMSLGNLPTALKISDIDPSNWYLDTKDADASEIFVVSVLNDPNDEYTIKKRNALYLIMAFKDGESNVENTVPIRPGDRIPFLGKEKAVVKIDYDEDVIYLGNAVYDGVLKEGEVIDVGNGYQVKIKQVLKSTTEGEYKVTVDILKDGKLVAEKSDTVNSLTGITMKYIYKDIGVVVHTAWMDVGENHGYAEVLVTKNTQEIDLGKKYADDYKAYAVVKNGAVLDLKSNIENKDEVVGIALRYEGDDLTTLEDGDSLDILDYVTFKFDDEDKTDRLFVYFSMDKKEEADLEIGQKTSILNSEITLKDIKANAVEPVALTAPIAKLDTEVSLDTADKNLVLVGGPVANKLTKELVDAEKLALDNNSPATIAVLKGEANGHDVIVVAGGDRDKTREAALELIKNL
jgi:S-layer protein (TIGR01564 family)